VTEYARRGRAAGHLPDTVYALVSAKDEWEFSNWDELRFFWGSLERSEQLKCRTVLRSVWRR
tara:strand:+ start:444 stop:629 length:186 start_codon:yes stop_codon:yes gene_type:complete